MFCTYTIKTNHHYLYHHIFRWPFCSSRKISFRAKFDSNCLYDTAITGDDINKLYGATDYYSTVHSNSVRFGWRHDGKGNIEIFAYWYVNGKRGFYKLGQTLPDQINNYEILINDDSYYFRFDEIEFITHRTKKASGGIRFRLFPYFGGDHKDPQTSTILIENIK